jgi:hypothetical protein
MGWAALEPNKKGIAKMSICWTYRSHNNLKSGKTELPDMEYVSSIRVNPADHCSTRYGLLQTALRYDRVFPLRGIGLGNSPSISLGQNIVQKVYS